MTVDCSLIKKKKKIEFKKSVNCNLINIFSFTQRTVNLVEFTIVSCVLTSVTDVSCSFISIHYTSAMISFFKLVFYIK